MRQMVPWAFIVLASLLVHCEGALEDHKKKNFGIFQVVRFENGPCEGSDGKNGTCYTEEECENKGGKSSGSCAEGYGVCCSFILHCGGTASENMTHFESHSQSTRGACNAKICKMSSSISQLRLDFMSFVIAGPSVATISTYKMTNGQSGGTQAVHEAGICDKDSFSVASYSGVPVICGTNTGYHMYVDADMECTTLSFHLTDEMVSISRQWDIVITQYEDGSMNKAPEGCLQYFYGSDSGTLETFNKANDVHLAYQNQNICIRREEGNCRICYSTATNDFQISAASTSSAFLGDDFQCGQYGTAGDQGSTFDFVVIPSPSKTTGSAIEGNGFFCGAVLVGATATGDPIEGTVCSKVTPFQIRFVSDGFEGETEAGTTGFKIHYEQSRC